MPNCSQESQFLAYIISSEGVRPNPKNIEAILDLPHPTNKNTLHKFLGKTII